MPEARLSTRNAMGISSHIWDMQEETFSTLAATFGFNSAVTNLFLTGPMETLTDFKYYFTGEWEIDAYLAAALGQ